jgi:hypothetical protein
VPLTEYQAQVARLLAKQRTPDSYLAGGAALHIEPNTLRFSNDLDYFNDSVERVASAFADDQRVLLDAGYEVVVEISQPGFVRASVRRGSNSTKVDWAHDSAWRFLPTIRHPTSGFQLHPMDLAVNKVLALVGRNEPRDLLDVLDVHEHVLSLGALCWAAAGKDPGYTPMLILDLLRRRGSYRPEDLARLHLAKPVELADLKRRWSAALDEADAFIAARPPDEVGCLYYSKRKRGFVAPRANEATDAVPHYGRPGGVLPVQL